MNMGGRSDQDHGNYEIAAAAGKTTPKKEKCALTP